MHGWLIKTLLLKCLMMSNSRFSSLLLKTSQSSSGLCLNFGLMSVALKLQKKPTTRIYKEKTIAFNMWKMNILKTKTLTLKILILMKNKLGKSSAKRTLTRSKKLTKLTLYKVLLLLFKALLQINSQKIRLLSQPPCSTNKSLPTSCQPK